MSKDKHRYGGAAIPDVPKKASGTGSSGTSGGRLKEIEDAIDDIKNSMVKSNRDNLDSMYNIGEENLDGAFRRLLKSYSDGIVSANASIKTLADSTGSHIEMITEWKKTVDDGTIQSISGIATTANAAKASVESFAEWKATTSSTLSTLSSSVATISTTATVNGSSISQIVSAVGANGQVNAASIVAAVNSADSSVVIDANHVDINGVVTVLKDDGKVLLDGNDITLIADPNGDSISQLLMGKYRYYYDTAESYTYDSMFSIKTVDNENDDKNLARFAVILETFNARDPGNDKNMATAMKLISCGSMSLESEGLMYIASEDGIILEPGKGTKSIVRIGTADGYDADNLIDGCYHFCWDGIYYGSRRILST